MVLKALISLPRKRLDANGSKLDMAYVTPQLIVSSMPTNDYWRSWYRTGGEELRTYLDSTHGENYKIWNLQQESENVYDDEFFHGRVVRHPMPDHEPPKFLELIEIVNEIDEWLQDENNIALVHCKAGMGRSGTVACAYLQAVRGLTKEKATQTFTEARMRNWWGTALQGVRIPSQLRYLGYVEQWRSASNAAVAMKINILHVTVRAPAYPDIEIDLPSAEIPNSAARAVHKWDRSLNQIGTETTLRVSPAGYSLYSPSDVSVRLHRTKYVKGVPVLHSKASVHFNAALETSAGPNGVVQMFSCPWSQLDGIGGTWLKGSALFESIEVHYTFCDAGVSRATPRATPRAVSRQTATASPADAPVRNSAGSETSAYESSIDDANLY